MQLLLAFFIAAAIMTIFEIAKTFLFSGIELWLSHVMTILFTSAMAAIVFQQLSKQKELLSSLDHSRHMLDAVSRTQSNFISNAGHHKTFASLLNILLDSSTSEFGFIGEVLHDLDGSPYLLTHAISSVADSSESGSLYGRRYSQQGVELRSPISLIGDVITVGQPVIVNDPWQTHRAIGLPPGYPDVRTFLGLPLYMGNSLIGMIGIANRAGGYDKSLCDELSPLLATCASLISAHRSHLARNELEKRLNLTKTAVDKSKVPFFLLSPDGQLKEVNDYACLSMGYAREEMVGKYIWDFDPGYFPESISTAWDDLKKNGSITLESLHRRKDGTTFPVEMTTNYVAFGDEEYGFAFARDITEKKQQETRAWEQANYDMLTRLPNRRLLQDRLSQEIKKAHRTGLPLALLFIDLDRFKEINDNLGHAKGDLLLVEAARRISGSMRETDTVARLGGDEFTVILPEFGERLHLERIAQDIIRELGEPFHFENDAMGYYISGSIGITLYPDDAQDVDSLLRHADQAMYRAKAEGRGRFSYFTQSMQQEAREKLALTQDLRLALARGELHVYYQPIIDLGSGRIVKAEALMRWKHPQRGMVSPAVFIPLAEESGLAQQLGDWVFQEATACVVRWRKQFGRIIQVGINKSPMQLAQKAGQESWSDKLQKMGLPGNSIKVEITEGALLKDSPTVRMKLLNFQNNGIEVSIDDFGTGFSSLSYLKQFDVDYLKIDKSFISNLTEDKSDRALTEAIIVMAHKLDIKTIAEGVETEGQRDLLQTFGCDYVQGYLYSPALPEEEFVALLAREQASTGG
jgi:diguanylate cyclase (GGDEF)-like protein/PAS domain S-box-containing protein